jgi:hypothetical protein
MGKAVINRRLGTFALSDAALALYFELTGRRADKYHMDRTDPYLIRVVEQLRDAANGNVAKLEVVEFDGNLYRICQYEGLEWLETPSTIEWVHCPES